MMRAVAPAISDLGAVVLVLAGLAKLRGATARAVAVGAVELGVAGVALVVDGRWSLALLAGAYAVLTAVAVRQARRGADCGCFGEASTVVGPHHIAANATITIAAGVAARQGAGPLVDRLGPGVGAAAAPLALLVVGATLVVALLTSAEDVRVARRSLRRGAPVRAAR